LPAGQPVHPQALSSVPANRHGRCAPRPERGAPERTLARNPPSRRWPWGHVSFGCIVSDSLNCTASASSCQSVPRLADSLLHGGVESRSRQVPQ
jgi:hypothetical protein